jgi:hypothetical protein
VGYRGRMRSRTFALTVAAGTASAVAFALVRLRGPAAAGRRTAPPDAYRCACGQDFRVTGTGRHRVYWLRDAAENEPVLSLGCPACDRPLPGTREAASGAARPAEVA